MTKEDLRNEWEYEFKAWIFELGSLPVSIIASLDKSEPYIMQKATVFKLEDGKYAMVAEDGCSCYDASQAQIDVYPNQEDAMEKFDQWRLGK